MLRVLGNLLQLAGFDYESSEAIRNEVIGTNNVADANFSTKLNNLIKDLKLTAPTAPTAASTGLQRVADVPIYFSDAIVRRSASLQKTTDAQVPNVMISPDLATKLGLHHGDAVRVSQGAVQVKLTAEIVSSLPANVVRLAAAHATTSVLGGMFGAISVEKI